MDVTYEFAAMGEVLAPLPDRIALDVGSKCIPGVIDHHFRDAGGDCAASLIVNRAGLVYDHLGPEAPDRLTIVLHREPDLDCVVAAYLLLWMLRDGGLPGTARALADYTRRIDAGEPPPDGIGQRSIWAHYAAATHLRSVDGVPADRHDDLFRSWIARGFDLLDAVVNAPGAGKTSIAVPRDLPGWEAERELIATSRRPYNSDLEKADRFDIELPCPLGGRQTVAGIRVTDPSSPLFKVYARAQGMVFTHVVYKAGRPGGLAGSVRHVIAVAPHCGVWLKGLGAVLEGEECVVRARTRTVRPGPPRWPDVTNADPWYDGRSPLHAYTIVDTPRGGSLLGTGTIVDIALDVERWIAVGLQDPDARWCPEGCPPDKAGSGRNCRVHECALLPAVIDGRFRFVSKLGAGGMGSVCRVRDEITQRDYALKYLKTRKAEPGKGPSTEERVARFAQEAELPLFVHHENLVKQFHWGADPDVGLYIVFELLHGTDLSDDIDAWRQRRRPYPGPRAESIVRQLLAGLSALHAKGIIHRDVKPANIQLVDQAAGSDAADPRVKLFDFGIALSATPGSPRFTRPQLIMCTPEYAPPEVLQAGPIDPRADLYSVGAVWHEMLTGAVPFGGPRGELQSSGQARRCRERLPPVNAGPHTDLLASLLARDPADRPASATEALGRMET